MQGKSALRLGIIAHDMDDLRRLKKHVAFSPDQTARKLLGLFGKVIAIHHALKHADHAMRSPVVVRGGLRSRRPLNQYNLHLVIGVERRAAVCIFFIFHILIRLII